MPRGGRRIPAEVREEAERRGLVLADDVARQLVVSTQWLKAAEVLGTGPPGRVLLRHNVAAYPKSVLGSWAEAQEKLLPSREVRETILAQEKAGKIAGPPSVPGARGGRRAGPGWLANVRAEAQSRGLILADDVASMLGLTSSRLRQKSRDEGLPEGRVMLRPTVAAYDAASVTRYMEMPREQREGRRRAGSISAHLKHDAVKLQVEWRGEHGGDEADAFFRIWNEGEAHGKGEHAAREPSRWCVRCRSPQCCVACKSVHATPKGDPKRLCPRCRKKRGG